jgi:hypothetical protein
MAKNRIKDFIQPYRIVDGKGFRLKDFDPADTGALGAEDREESRDLLRGGIARLSELQVKLYAQDH